MTTYYRTPKRFFKRPPEGKALYVSAGGDSLVEHQPREIGETLVVPTARYESNPRPIAGQDDPNGLEGRCRSFCLSEFAATEIELLEAVRQAYEAAHEGPYSLVLVTGPKEYSALSEEEGLVGTYDFGVAAFSWSPEELEKALISMYNSPATPISEALISTCKTDEEVA